MQGRINANQQRAGDNTEFGCDHEIEGVGQAVADYIHHRAAFGERGAKIGAQDPFASPRGLRDPVSVHIYFGPIIAYQPVKVLDHDRLVQAQLAFQAFAVFGAGGCPPSHRCQWIAHFIHKQKEHYAQDENERDGLQDTPENITSHFFRWMWSGPGRPGPQELCLVKNVISGPTPPDYRRGRHPKF